MPEQSKANVDTTLQQLIADHEHAVSDLAEIKRQNSFILLALFIALIAVIVLAWRCSCSQC